MMNDKFFVIHFQPAIPYKGFSYKKILRPAGAIKYGG
jgi:hypothetical protein